MQARAEETARHNLEDAAAHVVKAAEDAQLVVLAGEVQSRAGLYDLLPERVRRLTKEVDGGSQMCNGQSGIFTARPRTIRIAAASGTPCPPATG